jgi:hypothetical protein
MGLFDNLLGTTHSGEYVVDRLQQDIARQQQLAMMNSINTPPKPPNAFDPNNPAWSSGISTLVDLWLAKFGDKWVEGSELEGDIFFSIIATRLLKINRLERHNVPNKFHEVYRIVE